MPAIAMNEDGKLQEGAYFLRQMSSSLQEPQVFRFNLSAFLSAARSVAQFAWKEARTKSGGQTWYDAFVANDRLSGFFKSRRDSNVHDDIIHLDGHVDVFVRDAAHVSERSVVEKFDRDGNLIEVVEGEGSDSNLDAEWTTDYRFVAHYRFAEWEGPEEIPELCAQYLESLRRLVADGRAQGILSSPDHAA